MTTLDLDQNNAKYQIKAFKPGLIQVNEKNYLRSIIITADEVIEDWPPQHINELTVETLGRIIPLKPDILLIGTGSDMVLLSPQIYGELINAGIGVEIMATGAACRTFNALTAENRRVAAALIIQ